MIEYQAIAESSAVILTIYFLFFPIVVSSLFSKNSLLMLLSLVRLQLSINFLLFGITIILAVIENFYSFIFLIISLIFLPVSLNYMLKSFEYDLSVDKSLKARL